MSGHICAAIVVPVVLHEVVHIVEYHTVPVQVLHSLFEAHVKQHGSVKWLCAPLDRRIERDGSRERKEKETDVSCYTKACCVWPFQPML